MLAPPLLQQTAKPLQISLILLISLALITLLPLTESATRTYGSSCSSCNSGPSSSFLGGQALGNGVRGVLGNKLEHIAGFFNGLGGGGGGCNGCSSSCGSPGCGSHYLPAASNPCSSGGCYSSSCSTCASSSSSYSAPAHPSNTVTVIVQQPSSSSSGYDASAYPNCQCSYLFNTHGQGNCNGKGSRSYTSDSYLSRYATHNAYLSNTPQSPHIRQRKLRHGLSSDRWCYVASDVNGQWVEAQWACPDSVPSDVHHGRFWSRVACDTPGTHHHGK